MKKISITIALALCFLLVLSIGVSYAVEYAHPEVLASTDWLAAHLNDPTIVIVDSRSPQDAAAYAGGHIPGAVKLDPFIDLADPQNKVKYQMLTISQFEELMGKLGISNDKTVVVYDASGGLYSAYLWWGLKYYGDDNVKILNGGLTKWLKEGRPIEKIETQPAKTTFKAQVRPELLSTIPDVKQAIASPDIYLVNALPEANHLAGHIPTAKNIPAPSHIDPATQTLLPPDVLMQLWAQEGINPSDRVITYCGSGLYGSFDAFIAYLLGYEKVSLYDGSWIEWSADPSLPIEKPSIVAIDTTKPWRLSGNYFESCNCDIPCPCNVGGAPTHGFCRVMGNFHLVYGFYGDVKLDGINFSLLLDFPGAPKDGNATIATYIADNATPEQVEAIKNIVKKVIGPRTKKDLGTKLVPITFTMSGDTYTWTIPNILEMKSTLVRDMPDAPGVFARIYHQAKSDIYKYKDYGRDWDYSGKNSGQGRLLLPKQPSDAVVGTIRVGVFPNGMAVNPYTRTAITANTGDGTVSLIDLTTRKVTKTIPVGKNTVGPVINPNTNIAVVAGYVGDDTVSIIDLASGTVTKTITVGKVPLCIGIDTVHNIIVVANAGSNNVSVIDLTTEKVIKTIPVGTKPTCMHWDINPYTNQTIVTNTGENTLSVIDLVKGVEIQKIPVGKSPIGASLNPYTNIAVVSNTGDNTVSVVDLTAGKVITTIPVGGMPSCSVIEPTMNIALIANTADDTVSVISLNTMSVIDTIPVGVSLPGLSGCLAIDEATMTALIGNSGSNDVTIVDLKKIAPATVDFSNTFFMSLNAGLNMISLPLKPTKEMTARDLMKETGSTVVIKYDTDTNHFSGFSQAGSGNGFNLEGGKGYILNVPASKVVPFVGAAWTNEPPVLAPPSGLKSSGWAFVVSGIMSDYQTGDYTVTAKNLRTGNVSTDSIVDGRFNVVFADLNRNSVIEAGDKVEIVVKDSTGNIVAGPITKQIGTGDIQMAFSDVTIKFGYLRPQNSVLLQNYPNPFNPETWIPFNLAKEADVSVKIYDTGGKLVRSISLGRKDPGVYMDRDKAIHWDGKSDFGEVVSSGIYFYTIQAGEFSATRKMIVKK